MLIKHQLDLGREDLMLREVNNLCSTPSFRTTGLHKIMMLKV